MGQGGQVRGHEAGVNLRTAGGYSINAVRRIRPHGLVSPESLEAVWCERSVASSVLNVLVSEIGLKRAGIVAVVRELIATGMAEHMGVSFDPQFRRSGCPFDHPGEARGRKRRAALRDKYERRLRALALMASQGPQLAAGQRMCAGRTVLEAPDMQARGFEVDLLPSQVTDFPRP